MNQERNFASEDLLTHDQTHASSYRRIQKTTIRTTSINNLDKKTETRRIPTPVEYVSLFEGSVDSLGTARDFRLDHYTAVLTGINLLLVEMGDYIKRKRDTSVLPPRQVSPRLM